MSQRRPWQKCELAMLLVEYADTPTRALARSLGRSESAIYGRAAIMGLKKSDTYLAGPDACRLRRGDNVGAACFELLKVSRLAQRSVLTYGPLLPNEF